MTSLQIADAATRYERRVAHVRSVLDFHPEFRMALPYEELAIFDRYFVPDWVSAGNFFGYYIRLRNADPDIDKKMDAAFRGFHARNDLPMPRGE